MITRGTTAGLASLIGFGIMFVGSAAPSSAMTGIGCPDLPEYYRAVGTVENGEGSCGMSMAEARRILARGNPEQADAAQPAPRVHHKRHHRKAPQY